MLILQKKNWNKGSEVKDIKILMCSIKSHVETVNDKIKGNSSEEEDIGIRKCRRKDRFLNDK